MPTYVGAIDNGTTSTRFILFDVERGRAVASHQQEVPSKYPQPGWVEQDPYAILDSVTQCMSAVSRTAQARGIDAADVRAIGLTNQRETTVVWSRRTGKPLHNAIVWLDTRTGPLVDALAADAGRDHLRGRCGLPLSTYFSAVKLRWLLENVKAVRDAHESNDLAFGTVDSWLLYNLVAGKPHVTDATNASRTMLMDLATLQWDRSLCDFFGVRPSCLPAIRDSAGDFGILAETVPFGGVRVAGALGDQQAALLGHRCVRAGTMKNTYGTGCFLLYHTGDMRVMSKHGLLTTVASKLGPQEPAQYALEGSVAIAGAAVTWLRDQLGLLQDAAQVGALAAQVRDTGGVYFVPAFSGLFAPHWRDDARGTLLGLTQHTNRCHIARATLEAVCFQVREVLDVVLRDCAAAGLVAGPPAVMRADGGMSDSDLLMQMQANVLGLVVERPAMHESTAFGAALTAALGVGVWPSVSAMDAHFSSSDLDQPASDSFTPEPNRKEWNAKYEIWKCAIAKSLDWGRILSQYAGSVDEISASSAA